MPSWPLKRATLPSLPCVCSCVAPPLQKHEEEARLLELQQQLKELEQAEQQLTAEAEQLGMDAAQVRALCATSILWRWPQAVVGAEQTVRA